MTIPGSAIPLLLRSAAPAEYQISRSVRFNSSDSAYLSRTPASAGNRRTWTWAGWVKRSGLGGTQYLFSAGTSTPWMAAAFSTSGSDDRLQISFTAGVSGGTYTNNLFRDASAWYHILFAVDTTQATAANRIKVYVNGLEATFSSTNYPSQNSDTQVNGAVLHTIGRSSQGADSYFSGYLADVHFIDGQALTPSSFTEVSATTGQLIPKAYTGSFGTNGFWLKFSDNSAATATTLGKDYSGNNNNWTPNNLSVTAGAGNDSLVDTPTSYGTDTGAGGEVRGNYCTWNPLDKAANTTLANGNLDCTWAASSGGMKGTIGISSGKWYWEVTVGANTSVGLIKSSVGQANSWPGDSVYGVAGSYGYAPNGQKVTNSSYSAYGSAHVNGDVVGVAYDADNGKLFFSRNGTWQASGDPVAGTNAAFTSIAGEFSPGLGYWTTPTTNVNSANFGQRPFAYTAPSGFKALCDTNLPAPVVAKPSEVMDVKLYTGNGSTQTISGLGFSPDLVWTKGRSYAYSNNVFDTVRTATKRLTTDATNAEDTLSGVTAFNSDGFTLGSATGLNDNGITYVAWTWDAGTSTVTNTQGSITSSVRANASAGFSVVTFTKTGGSSTSVTVGHGLGAEPHMIIVKNRNTADDWYVYTKVLGNTKRVQLNSTSAEVTGTNLWGSTTPTSTVFTVRALFDDPHVAYCFAPVAGYSSFGSYTGNGSADGPFVFTGMRPRWVMIKRTDSTANWRILDTSRDTYNIASAELYPSLSNAEGSFNALDINSNGFKIRTSDVNYNASGGAYIFACFAEFPLQYARAR